MKNADMPAIPTQTYDHGAAMQGLSVTVTDQPGLTKREMFAMHAMQAWITHNGSANNYRFNTKVAALSAIECADALLEELERTK